MIAQTKEWVFFNEAILKYCFILIDDYISNSSFQLSPKF